MSCDAELQELMVQVDRMVEEKKLEWQDRIRITEGKLNSCLKENTTLRNLVEEKNSELEAMKNHLKLKESLSNVSEYDQEVLELRLELSQLKKSYDKYHHKYSKKLKEIEKDKEDLGREKMELLRQLNEARAGKSGWELERTQLTESMDEMRSERAILELNVETLREQLRLGKQELTDHSEDCRQRENHGTDKIHQLEARLKQMTDGHKKELDESCQRLTETVQQTQRGAEERHQLLLRETEATKRMMIRLESELGRASAELRLRDKAVFQLEHALKMAEKTVAEKNDVIKILQVSSHSHNTSSKELQSQGAMARLESQLQDARIELRSSRRAEKELQGQLALTQKKMLEMEHNRSQQLEHQQDLERSRIQTSKIEESNRKLSEEVSRLKLQIQDKSYELSKVSSELIQLQSRANDYTTNTNNAASPCDPKSSLSSTGAHSMPKANLEKEMEFMLKFCEEKDFLIQRLQMENRVLQDFIAKLNSSMTGELPFLPLPPDLDTASLAPTTVAQPQPHDVLTGCSLDSSVGNSFHTLRQTFFDDTSLMATSLLQQQQQHPYRPDPKSHQNQYMLPSSRSQDQTNAHVGYNIEPSLLHKSSEEFISMLKNPTTLTDNMKTTNSSTDRSIVLDAYPTLTAARFFSEERERTRHLEHTIDQHVCQLRKDAAHAEWNRQQQLHRGLSTQGPLSSTGS